jgi:hypothetical protein
MQIFLSYRREDASPWAGRLHDGLADRIGDGNVFQDVEAVRPGQDFADAIVEALDRADAALVVIGPRWLAPGPDGDRPRLFDDQDVVRAELVAALARCRVVPVLVGGARMPTIAQLPEDVRPLAHLQAVSLRDETWHRDLDDMFGALGIRRVRGARGARRWLTGAIVVVVGVIAAAVAVAVQGGGDDASDAVTASLADATTTSFDTDRRLPECPSPSSGEWTALAVSGIGDVGAPDQPAGREVFGGGARAETDGRWLVVLDAGYTNRRVGSVRQYWWYYSLAAGGSSTAPECFSVVGGNDPAGPQESSRFLVGFRIAADPAAGGALLIDNIGDRGRIDLAPT